MKTKGLFLAACMALLFIGTQSALAQSRTADMNLTVTANNLGIFTCDLDASNFDFGDVDADGTTSSTGITGTRNGANDGAFYDATGAAWTCRAAPSATVSIALNSVSTDHTAGSMSDDNLQVGISNASSGTVPSPALQDFTSGADLITGVAVGNGTAEATGDLDLRLHVYDADATGANTWVVKLQAREAP